ncbi:MAG: hypothetical protein RL258_181, partial [Pseudomonadota bacterium]
PADRILQMSSAKSPAPQIVQMPSDKSSTAQILQTTSGHALDLSALAQAFPLPWSAYVRLLSVKNPQARAFYETEALRSGWTIAQLNRQIASRFYERTALSANKAAMLDKGEVVERGYAITPEHAGHRPQGRQVQLRRCWADALVPQQSTGTISHPLPNRKFH